MGTQFNTLFRGSPTQVMHILSDTVLGEQDLRAALTNAFDRIDRLEQRLAEVCATPGKPDLRNLTVPVLVTAAKGTEALICGLQTKESAKALMGALRGVGFTTTLFLLDGKAYTEQPA